MSSSCFEKYDVLGTYDHQPTLSNASNETIEVLKVSDIRSFWEAAVVFFGLITNLDFNVLSRFVAWQREWHTMLTNSPHIQQEEPETHSPNCQGPYAVATLKDGGDQMKLDVV